MIDSMVWVCLIVFLVMILMEVPIPFSMMISSLLYAVTHGQSFLMFAQRTANSFGDFTMVAVPAFVFVGSLMNEVGVADRIFNFARKCLGHIPGGLGHANVLASMIFAGMSGSALADAGGLGLIELKAMREAHYDDDFIVAVTAASSGIGPIIPPSINFVVYAFMAQVSTVAMFVGGIVPGILMGLSLMAYIYWAVKVKGEKGDIDPKASFGEVAGALWKALPALFAPVLLIGGILSGVMTPTECGCLCAVYILILAVVYRSLSLRVLVKCLKDTLSTTAMVMLLIATGSIFNWMLITGGFINVIANLMAGLNSSFLVLLVLNIILLIFGCFMGQIPSLIIILPIMSEMAQIYGFSMVHLGVIAVLNLTYGLVTPPMAPALFLTCQIADVDFSAALKKTLPMLVPLVTVLLIATYCPILVTGLPKLFGLI